jgi:hypothetical protein
MLTRRAFVSGAAGLVAVLGAPRVFSFATRLPDPARRRVLAFEQQGLEQGRSKGPDVIERRTLDLEHVHTWADLDRLSGHRYSAIAAAGSAAAVFALKTQLGGAWRMVVRGSHGPAGHRLVVGAGVASLLAPLAASSATPREYLDALLRLDTMPCGEAWEPFQLEAPRWDGGRAEVTTTLLAWPARIV